MPFTPPVPLTIKRIWLIPWEIEQDEWGVAYEFADGGHSCDVVGTKAEAQAVVDEVERQRKAATGENVIDLASVAGRYG